MPASSPRQSPLVNGPDSRGHEGAERPVPRLMSDCNVAPSTTQPSSFSVSLHPTVQQRWWNPNLSWDTNNTLEGLGLSRPIGDPNPAIIDQRTQTSSAAGSTDKENIGMPDWIAFIKPRPRAGENVITFRRETHIALDIILDRLPKQPINGSSWIKIPSTRPMKNSADTAAGKTPLELRVLVYGATTRKRYETGCKHCKQREGKTKGALSLLAFHAHNDVIEPKGGKIRIDFSFCCYPRCHKLGDAEYLLEVVLYEDIGQGRIVAQYELPFSFNVLARIPTANFAQSLVKPAPVGRKRKRVHMEQLDGTHQAVYRPNVRPLSGEPSQRDFLGDGWIDHSMLDTKPWNSPQGSQHQDTSSSSSLPPVPPPLLPRNVGASSGTPNAIKPPNQATTPSRKDGERAPTLTEVNPDSASIRGDERIWLKGEGFPARFPLYARFGSVVVPTTFDNPYLLACTLPPATTPGVVDITLSTDSQPNAPEYGSSLAKFQYLGENEKLIPILLRTQGQGDPNFTPILQTLLIALTRPQFNGGLLGWSHGAESRDDLIETHLVGALSSLQARPNFHEIVSTTNDYNQTLAHLSIFYGYSTLLGSLVEWRIDLTTADANGLTALHWAYLKGDRDSVRILRRGGASETVTDNLGRRPSELQPEGLEEFDPDIDVDGEVAAGLDTGMYAEADGIDEQPVFEDPFSALDLDGLMIRATANRFPRIMLPGGFRR